MVCHFAKTKRQYFFQVIFDLFAKLIQDDENCISNGQAEEMIPLATSALSQSRLNMIGALCGKYASEIVDHLLSQSCDHTMAYLSRVGVEICLSMAEYEHRSF